MIEAPTAVVFLVTSFVGWCPDADRAHRKSGEHLDACLPVSGIDELHAEPVLLGTSLATR
jgi:hypothetical protein